MNTSTMAPHDTEEEGHKLTPNPCGSVKSESRSPTKYWRGSLVKSCSIVKGPAVARSKILNMDLTSWDEARNMYYQYPTMMPYILTTDQHNPDTRYS